MGRSETSDNRVEAVTEVLAPRGVPIFEWGHETTPTPGDIRRLAEEIVSAIDATSRGRSES